MGDSPQAQQLPWHQEALNLAWHQQAPASWHVFPGKKALLPAYQTLYIVSWLILLFCPWPACIALIVLKGGFTTGKGPAQTYHSPPWPDLNVLLYCLVAGAIIVGLALVAAIMTRRGVARRTREDPQPLVIVLPEGWVQYLSPGTSIDTFVFAQLADLEGRIDPSPQEITTLADLQSATDLSQRSAKGSSDEQRPAKSLDLKRRGGEGKRESWSPNACFGPPETICAAILGAYAHYVARSRDASDPEAGAEG